MQFSCGVMRDAKKFLKEKRDKASYRRELAYFHVSRIRVIGGAMVLTMDFVPDVR